MRIQDEALGWGARTEGGTVVAPIDGVHPNFMREPEVASLGRQISKCLRSLHVE